GDAILVANTGSGSISPELVTFANGTWSGSMTFFGAGNAVSFRCFDFSAPPRSGTSNSFVVQPGPLAALQVLLPGETPRGVTVTIIGGTFSRVLILAPGESPAPGTSTGRTGTATDQSINYAFTVTVMAADQWWNPVGGVSDVVHVASGDPLAQLPPDQAMVNG